MKKLWFLPILILLLLLTHKQPLFAFCETGCNRDTDQVRFLQLSDHLNDLEAIIQSLNSISQNNHSNFNQLSLLTASKNNHAKDFKTILSDYFLSYRIQRPLERSPKADRLYEKQLTQIHQLILICVKLNETNDVAFVVGAREILKEFAKTYGQAQSAYSV